MPEGAAPVLENRSLASDYSTLASILTPGLRVLDVGCGTGTISSGIAPLVGPTGHVTGIDSSEALIQRGKSLYGSIPNLELIQVDLFAYEPESPYDLIVSARVLQWLDNPLEAVKKIKTWLRPGGQLSVLDYDHTALEFEPEPPASMQRFYASFLRWRADAGMNNQIAKDLPDYFSEAGFTSIEIIEANETYRKGEANFLSKIGIWTAVAESRGKQLVSDGYMEEADRLATIAAYDSWIAADAQRMTMKLNEVRGRNDIKSGVAVDFD